MNRDILEPNRYFLNMENQFCITQKKLVQIFWGNRNRVLIDTLIRKFSDKFSLPEMFEQMKTDKGEVGKYFKGEIRKFTKKTENEEIAHAITLADFYFLDSNPVICFKAKRKFKKEEIQTHKGLLENMESNTEIDCLIKDDHKEFKFQLKQYPEKYKEWSTSKVIDYLDRSILSKGKYNNEGNRDLIIVIAIKPERNSRFKEVQDFDKIHKHLSDKDIKLLEINFLYNRNNEHMVWFQVFPKNGHFKIPLQELSHNEARRF